LRIDLHNNHHPMTDDSILIGQSLAGFQLGWPVSVLLERIGQYDERADLEGFYVLAKGDFKFWIDEPSQTLMQIGAEGGFQGKLEGKIGLGSTLEDVRAHFGDWSSDWDCYQIAGREGFCFELSDAEPGEAWVEEEMPIRALYVFTPEEG